MNGDSVKPADVDARRRLTERLVDAATAPQLSRWTEDHQVVPREWVPAYELTVAMGHCRLFGFTPEDETLVAPLVPIMVEAALRGSFRQVRWTLQNLRDLERDLAESDSRLEDYEMAIRILEGRFDLEACRSACRGSLAAYRQAGVAFPSVLLALRGAQDEALQQIDQSMSDQRDLLAVADETYWVENLRGDLEPRAWQPRPWWLGDEIERLRMFQKRFVRSLLAAADEMVVQIPHVPKKVELSADPLPRASDETPMTLAADAQAERPPEELLLFEQPGASEEGTMSDRVSISFRLEQGHQAAAVDALPASAEVTVRLEVDVPRSHLDVAEGERVKRKYVVRWGVQTMAIEVGRTVGAGVDIVQLIGTGRTSWANVKSLFEASEKRVRIRRIE